MKRLGEGHAPLREGDDEGLLRLPEEPRGGVQRHAREGHGAGEAADGAQHAKSVPCHRRAVVALQHHGGRLALGVVPEPHPHPRDVGPVDGGELCGGAGVAGELELCHQNAGAMPPPHPLQGGCHLLDVRLLAALILVPCELRLDEPWEVLGQPRLGLSLGHELFLLLLQLPVREPRRLGILLSPLLSGLWRHLGGEESADARDVQPGGETSGGERVRVGGERGGWMLPSFTACRCCCEQIRGCCAPLRSAASTSARRSP
mmetsp:Transcript_239/g.505  ORF Transcript_239/g.505 Transcript_239/m.505 type:complete len:260 (-) Transcript_239:18-797(-)